MSTALEAFVQDNGNVVTVGRRRYTVIRVEGEPDPVAHVCVDGEALLARRRATRSRGGEVWDLVTAGRRGRNRGSWRVSRDGIETIQTMDSGHQGK